MPPVPVTIYTREGCSICPDAIETIERIAEEEDLELDLSVVDVDDDPELRETYGDRVPYVLLDGRPAFKFHVDPVAARSKLRAFADE